MHLPKNDVKANQPPAGYEQGLESYLFKPLQEEFITLLQESKNSTTGNPWFDHVSTWFIQPQELITYKQFPAVFVLVPNAIIQIHGMNQLAFLITLQFEYYSRHHIRNVTNELSHFVERLWYLIQTNLSLKFGKFYNGNQLCATKIGLDDGTIEFDYFVDTKHVIRSVTVTASAYVPILKIEPP